MEPVVHQRLAGEEGALEELPGIGKDLAAKIQEYLTRGEVEYLEELRKEIPAGVIDLMGIHGVGPKTAKHLYEQVGVDSVEKLEELAKAHKVLSTGPGELRSRLNSSVLLS